MIRVSRVTLVTLIALFLFVGFFTRQARAASVKEGSPETYTVHLGNSLWRIARAHCGNPLLFGTIKDAKTNAVIKAPYTIYPREELIIPCSTVAAAANQQTVKAIDGNVNKAPDNKQAPPKADPPAHVSLLTIIASDYHRLSVTAKKIRWNLWWFGIPIGLLTLVTLFYFGRFIAVRAGTRVVHGLKRWRGEKKLRHYPRVIPEAMAPIPSTPITEEPAPMSEVLPAAPINICAVPQPQIKLVSADVPDPILLEDDWHASPEMLQGLAEWTKRDFDLRYPSVAQIPEDQTLNAHVA